jgi:hypothetical protein
LKIKEAWRVQKLAKVKTSLAKKEKNKRKYEKLKEHTVKAKVELHKRQGTYRKGMNLDDPFGPLIDGQDGEDASAKKPPAKRLKSAKLYCEYCGKLGHVTMKSKSCAAPPASTKQYRKVDGTLLTEPQRFIEANTLADAEDDVNDCDNFDSMPLVALHGDEELPFDIDVATASWPNAGTSQDGASGVI